MRSVTHTNHSDDPSFIGRILTQDRNPAQEERQRVIALAAPPLQMGAKVGTLGRRIANPSFARAPSRAVL